MIGIIVLYILIVFIFCIYISYKFYKRVKKKELNDTLANLQKITANFPFLEDKDFIYNLISQEKYGDIHYLQYKEYCEMLFGFVETTYDFYKSEKKMLDFCDFKSWIRNHKALWNKYSYRYEYSTKVKHMIDNWLKD
ncbi:MAG: hypothetical protein IKN42_07790 [Elusimicrobia bacterium]|nr:hypothetical protein [Elusimicrobiota bacterium]